MARGASVRTVLLAGQHTDERDEKDAIEDLDRRGFVVVAGAAFAPTALADPDHGSCKDLFTGVLVPMAHAGVVGDTASEDAPLDEIIASFMAAHCAPRP